MWQERLLPSGGELLPGIRTNELQAMGGYTRGHKYQYLVPRAENKQTNKEKTQLRIAAGSTLPNPASVSDLHYIQDNYSTST